MVALHEMRRHIAGEFRLGESLARYSAFRVGGPADYFVRPVSQEDFADTVRYFRRNGIPWFIAAVGSNTLISDRGFRGAAIAPDPGLTRLGLANDGVTVHAGAGVRLSRLVDFCIQRSLQGAEFLAGLNGSIGGAIWETSSDRAGLLDRLVAVELLREDEVIVLSPPNLRFQREGAGRDVLLSATLRFMPGDQGELLRRRRNVLVQRNRERPLNIPNSGCMFRDPEGEPAAMLVERAGMKGRTHGGAMVSELAANNVTNSGDATADDILALLREVQEAVRKRCGVMLRPAVRLIGFDTVALGEVA